MKRRYLCISVSAFATGIVLCVLNLKIFTAVCIAGMICGLMLLLKNRISLLFFAILFLCGGLYGNYANTKTSGLEKYTTTPCNGEMIVTGIESFNDSLVTVNATVTRVNDEKISEPVLFTIYGISDVDVNKKIYFEDVKFKIPDDARNDGGFDYRHYLKSRGIYFIASADVKELKAKGVGGFVVFRFFRTLKQELARRCNKIWGESYATEIIPAILSGNDIFISKSLETVFSKAGISHILVASGMHVAIVLLVFSVLLFPLKNKRWFYDFALGAAVICFAMLVGYTPSITRSVSSFFIYYIARKILRSADPVTVLFEAMAIILIVNPLSVYNLSFLLSFSAVFGIIMFIPHIMEGVSGLWNLPMFVYKLPNKLLKWILKGKNAVVAAVAVSASAQLGVLPFLVISFGGSSAYTIFINLIVAVLAPTIFSFGIAAVIFNIEPFVTVTKWLCDALVAVANFTIKIPGNYITFPQSNIVTVSIICFVAAWLLRCKSEKFGVLCAPIVYASTIALMLSYTIVSYVPENKAEVTFLNVEQGDCAIIRLANRKTVVIDTGTEDMCDDELIPYLERKNIVGIETLIVSHNDNDHAGGAKLLTDFVNTDRVAVSKYSVPNLENTKCLKYEKGDKFSIGNADFEILSPKQQYNNDNDNSLVVRMDFGKSSFLFTGDASEKVEKTLENVDTDVLKVSHHGAKSASSEGFLKKVSPKYSVISVDKNNSYGHPDENVITRLDNVSEYVFRTDRDKTVTIMCDLEGNLKLTKRLQKAIIDTD